MGNPSVSSSRRVILHVGLHKTGTTTIQTALAQGGDFVYPAPGPNGPGHADLAHRAYGIHNWVASSEVIVDLVAATDRLAPFAHPIVLSSEEFSRALGADRPGEPLRMLTDRFATEVVVTIRQDDERVAAMAAELIVNGRVADMDRYWTLATDHQTLQPDLVPRLLGLADWSAAHVVQIDTADPEHIFRAFESIVGAPIRRTPPRNTRWPRIALSVMNELNDVAGGSLTTAERRKLAVRVAQIVTKLAPEAAVFPLSPVPEEVLAPLRERWLAELQVIRSLAADGHLHLYEPAGGGTPAASPVGGAPRSGGLNPNDAS
jgi:hypothetical protein